MPHQQTKPDAPDQAVPGDRDAQLPHDRDERAGSKPGTEPGAESDNAQHDQNRKSMERALADTESKIVDTERRGIPSDVPSSSDNG